MKKYRFKFSPLIVSLMILVLLAAIAGLTLNIIRCCSEDFDVTAWNVLSVALMLFVCALLIVIVIGLFFATYYTFKGDKLVTRYGIIKSEIAIKAISEIVYFKKTEKLVIYFDEDKYSVVVVKKDWYDDFVREIRKINPAIRYDSKTSPDEDEPDKK